MGPVRQLHPISQDVDLRQTYRDLDFPVRPDRPYLALNFVTSVDGRVTVDGRATGLGSAVDRDLMRQLRSHADALLVGAGTLRAEAIDPRVPTELADQREAGGRPRQPAFVLITATAELPDRKLFRMSEVPRLILTTRNADVDRIRHIDEAAEVVILGDSWIDTAEAMRYLRSRGIGSVICEGGPGLAGELVAGDLADELFVTVAPSVVGGKGLRLVEGPLAGVARKRSLDLLSVYEHGAELFLRYRLAPGEPAS